MAYRRLGKPGAYVRQRGFEPLQQMQMVRQYVEKYGSISRAEVAELCQTSAPQAYRLLKSLVKQDVLEPSGKRWRSVRYAAKAQ